MSGFGGVVVLNHLCLFVEGWFEQFTGEFVLVIFADLGRDTVPHAGDEGDVPHCCATAKFVEHAKVPSGNSSRLSVGDAVDVNDPGKLSPFLISMRLSPEDSEMTNVDAHLPVSQMICNHPQSIQIVQGGITESRSIDESHHPSVENELVCELDLCCTRSRARSNL